MKWLNDYKMKSALFGFVAAIVFGNGNAKADFTFGPAENLGPTVNSPSADAGASIMGNGLELYFGSDRSGGGYAGGNIWVAKRPTKNDEWGEPVNLGPAVNWGEAGSPAVTGDGLELYFVSARTGGYGQGDIWVTKRESKDSPWGEPENLGSPPNTSKHLWGLGVSFDGLEVYFSSGSGSGGYGAGTNGGHDIWVTKRAHKGAPWSEPEKIGPTINGPDLDWEHGQALSSDGLTIIFSSSRLGGFSTNTDWNFDLWMARRETIDAPWGEAVNLGPSINTRYSDMARSLSADGRILYFDQRSYEGYRPGGQGGADIWQAPIIPIVDFNGDGIVEAADMCIMIDHWGEDYSLCDIGPMPFGDGIVDVEDLKVLAEHLFEDCRLIAHWKLDETEGDVAYDSAGSHNATLCGNPIWQPTEAKIDGALQLDGIDDYGNAGFVLNPSSGSFSAYAWIKGSTPGQAIISQTDGIGFGGTWLGADQTNGKLFTNLMYFELASETVITDGQWHHVGIVWDGSRRSLYVDEEEVARDTNDMTAINSNGDLYLGTGKNLDAGTFFSGLIDDIRIYNRVVHP